MNSKETAKSCLVNCLSIHLSQSIKLVNCDVCECGEFYLIISKLIRSDNTPIDYSMTDYQEQIDSNAFDESVLSLIEASPDGYKVLEFTIGATDAPIVEWLEKHKLHECFTLFGVLNKS